jgi:exonuclease III
MRIVSWNIRAGGGKRITGIFKQLLSWKPHVVALTEFRGTVASQKLATQLAEAGWPYQLQTIDEERKVTNALLTASKYPLERLEICHAPNQPRRWLLAGVMCDTPFVMGNMHIPNFNTGYKYQYLKAVLEIMRNWQLGPAFFLGDTNSGKSYIDDVTGIFWKREHEWMEAIEALDWVDAFRHMHGDERVYTWYSHKNNGFRLDQAFLNPEMMPALQMIGYEWGSSLQEPVRRDELSDHAAIILDLDLSRLD